MNFFRFKSPTQIVFQLVRAFSLFTTTITTENGKTLHIGELSEKRKKCSY